jgi:hypothetical protein
MGTKDNVDVRIVDDLRAEPASSPDPPMRRKSRDSNTPENHDTENQEIDLVTYPR